MENENLKSIDKKLAIIIGLLAAPIIGELSIKGKVEYLLNLGLDSEDISNATGINLKTVRETVSRLKTGKRPAKNKPKGIE
jgi:hypothetical protein